MRLLFLLLVSVTGFGQRSIDVLHYVYNVSISDSGNRIHTEALITLAQLKKNTPISIDLASTMQVSKVWNATNKTTLQFTHNNNQLLVNLNDTSSLLTIGITYSGVPTDGLIISKNKFGQRTFFSDHWPNRAHHWLACVDHPSEKASVEFIVKAPNHYQVMSNGSKIEETNLDHQYTLTHWKETTPLPVKVICLAAAPFSVNYSGNVDTIPVYSWVFPGNKDAGIKDYAEALQILPYFIKQIGPYPFRQLSNIQSKTIFGGMENAGAIFYSEHSVTGKQKAGLLIAHEIAHQWFGNMVTEADWPHLWLSEGFATYLSLLYLEHTYGQDTFLKSLQQNRNKIIQFAKKSPRPVVDNTITNYMELLNANSYEKGGWVLHMLRREIGDSLFWQSIQQYYQQYSGKNAVTNDFRSVVESVSGKNFQQFFQQWLYTAGHPKLLLNHAYDKNRKMLTVTIQQEQNTVFSFPLTLAIRIAKDNILSQVVDIQNRTSTIEIPLSSAPLGIVMDPYCSLLYE